MPHRILQGPVDVEPMPRAVHDRGDVEPGARHHEATSGRIARVHHPVPDDVTVEDAQLKHAPGLIVVVAVVLRDQAVRPALHVAAVDARPERHRQRGGAERRRRGDDDVIVDAIEETGAAGLTETIGGERRAVDDAVVVTTAAVPGRPVEQQLDEEPIAWDGHAGMVADSTRPRAPADVSAGRPGPRARYAPSSSPSAACPPSASGRRRPFR